MSSVGVLCLLYICLSKHSVWISSVLQRLLFLFSSSLCFVLVLLCLSSVIYFSLVINCLSHGGVFCQFICNVCHTTLIYNSTLRLCTTCTVRTLRLCTTCTVCTLRLYTMCTVFLVCEQILWFHRRNSSKSNFSSANLTLIIFFIVVNNFLQWLANFCGESDAGLHRLMGRHEIRTEKQLCCGFCRCCRLVTEVHKYLQQLNFFSADECYDWWVVCFLLNF